MPNWFKSLFQRAENLPQSTYSAALKAQSHLVDSLMQPVILCDEHMNILHVNPLANKVFPKSRKSHPLQKHFVQADIFEMISAAMRGESTEPLEYLADDGLNYFLVSAQVIQTYKAGKSAPTGLILFENYTDSAKDTAMRAEFLANASHELKTPVASLLGYIETLRGHAKNDPEAQELFLGIMQQQAERMQRLIDDILSLRRIEISEHEAPTQTADLFLAARAAMEAADPIAAKRGVDIIYRGPEEALVKGVQDELVQLILNLLDNAVVISTGDMAVTLDLEVRPDVDAAMLTRLTDNRPTEHSHKRVIVPPSADRTGFAVLTLSDAGPGFSPEHLERIGERFYKINSTERARKKGTGLGLAIVKHIMRRHRGGLFVTTGEGAGTEFTVALPMSSSTDRIPSA